MEDLLKKHSPYLLVDTTRLRDDSATDLKVSIVIPVRNEQEVMVELIAALQAQTFRVAEIVIVDGGSTDQTVSISRNLTRGDDRFRVIEAGDATPGRGRNVGIEAARNDWIALTDAGNRPEAQWLEELVKVVRRDPSVEIVYGNFEPITDSFFTRCAALAYVVAKQERDGDRIRAPSIVSALMRREVWRRAGGFPDLRAAEDLMFIESVERQGSKVAWCPSATVWWHLQPTLASTYRKFAVYSRHNVWAGRQRFWHYGIARMYLLALPFVVLAIAHRAWWLAILIAGFAVRIASSIWQRREQRGLLWALNPIQFLGVALIVLTIDLATFVGWIQALGQRPADRPAPESVT